MAGSTSSASNKFDLLVIGSGPAGQKAAIQASKLARSVALIDDRPSVGGTSIHLGTIPSKSFREAVLHLTGYRQRTIYGSGYSVKAEVTMEDLNFLTHFVLHSEVETTLSQIKRNHIELVQGRARFVDASTLEVQHGTGRKLYKADRIIIATGAKPARAPGIEFDTDAVFDSDNLLKMKQIPRSMAVIGGGVVGLEYASMFAVLGVEVTVIDGRSRLLEFADQEIVENLMYRLRGHGVVFRLGEFVESCAKRKDGKVATRLKSGKLILSECALFSAGRVSCTEGLGLEELGIKMGKRGEILVNKDLQTEVPTIYAAGDVIGFPGLSSTSAEQGRLACCHALGDSVPEGDVPLPYGIYSIPEVAMVGKNEQELTEQCVPYEIGVARYKELTKATLRGDQEGLLKIIFHRKTGELLGVHAIGEDATEIIHIGQMMISFKGTLDRLVRSVFNYPTFSGAYKVAALDGYNKLRGREDD